MGRSDISPDGSILVTAPAKVNLFLHIVGRRDDGYHELESLFAFTRTGDEIALVANEALTLDVSGPFANDLSDAGGAGSGNLVCKAATLLAESVGRKPHVKISLSKNLPVASGIGGGSADAAATLLGLNDLWDLGFSREELCQIALSLGADVPACLYQNPLFVSGIGERISTAKLPIDYGIMLVNPLKAISTPAVFKSFKESHKVFDQTMGSPLELPYTNSAFIEFLRAKTRNSLQSPAENICDDVKLALQELKRLPEMQYAAMSGSGATCFALFESEERATVAAEEFQKLFPSWWVVADTLVAA